MDVHHFDALTRLLGARIQRRRLAGLSSGALAALLGLPALADRRPNRAKRRQASLRGAKKKKCTKPKKRCGKKCVDVRRDRANCGRCGKKCPSGQRCQDRACVAPPPQHRYEFVLEWGSRGDGEGQFFFPRGIAVDASGVYVVDSGTERVQKFRPV